MANPLIEKIRKARKSWVELSGFKFEIRRPTDYEASQMKDSTLQDVVSKYVTGWDNVKEIDIFSSGNPVPAEFDSELWAEWVSDRPDFWEPLATAILESYQQHRTVSDEAVKN
jgi:hypothetical protein